MSISAAVPKKHRVRNPATKVTVVGSHKASADSVKMAFEDNAPDVRNIEGIPRFAIVGNDNKFYLGIGASMRLNAVWDTGDENASVIDFVPASFTAAPEWNRSSLGFSAQTSNVYLNIVALPARKDQFSLFLSLNFKNPNYGVRLSHFYARYRGLTLGYTDSPFVDGDAVPLTIDDEGPNGTTSYSNVTAYWTQDFGKGFSGAAGIDTPSSSITYSTDVEEVRQRIVTVPAYVQYRWNDGSHVRVSGLFRPMQYCDKLASKNRMLYGWGIKLSGLWGITPKLCAYYDVVGGSGIADYICDGGAGIGADATPSLLQPGFERTTGCWGMTVGLSYEIIRNLTAHGVYSQLHIDTNHRTLSPDTDYRYGQYVAVNLIYNINPYVTVGMEYNWGKRVATTREKLHVNRLQALFSLSF